LAQVRWMIAVALLFTLYVPMASMQSRGLGVLTGQIRGHAGEQVAGGTVKFMVKSGNPIEATSNKDGRWRVSGIGKGEWMVVGTFRAGDSAANSEIWADLNQLRGDFEQRGGSSSLLVRADLSLEDAEKQAAGIEAVETVRPKTTPPPRPPRPRACRNRSRSQCLSSHLAY